MCTVLAGYQCLLFSEHPLSFAHLPCCLPLSSFPYACGTHWPDPQATVIMDPKCETHTFHVQYIRLLMVASYTTTVEPNTTCHWQVFWICYVYVLCSVGNTWPICKRSQTELDVHFTFENVLIITSSSSVTFNNVCTIV